MSRLDASCRVAIAALLHDLGKFAERARIPEAEKKGDAHGNTRLALNKPLYCPQFNGRYTHVHAAYAAIAMDLLEQHFPELVGEDMEPFAPWREKNADDSIINAAAKHHRPDTFLQWVIATADRLASGFEREEFNRYNAGPEETETQKNHYTARQWTLLEQIRLESDRAQRPDWRYPLKPLSPQALFPVRAEGYERNDNEAAQREYRELWEQFVEGLKSIPRSHRRQLHLWLDHFESCWLTYTHAIPSATAFGVNPDVSLYDHAKAVAALGVALWRWHHDRGEAGDQAREQLRLMWDKDRKGTPEAEQVWNEPKFLLIQGDFWGIQDFIFATGGETQRQAAKLLRGRSFYVSLLTECAALKVLEALDLPSTSQVTNAAGKFLIVAPNAQGVAEKLQAVQREINEWFLAHTFGQSGIGLAWLEAAASDFRRGEQEQSPFHELMKRLFEQLETAKLQRFGLCGPDAPSAVFTGFLDQFDRGKGVCSIDGRSPAIEQLEPESKVWVSKLAADQVRTGKYLAQFDRLLITRTSLDHNTLRLPIFGYHVNFTADEDATGRFGREAESGNLVRAWDFSLPDREDQALWNGYARRYINAYVARFRDVDLQNKERYESLKDVEPPALGEVKTLNHLALDDRERHQDGTQWIGVEALMTLKGDVDNLGLIFQKGLKRPTFAKMAALSRQMNAFFAIWLPWTSRHEFPNTYTVFAGGDDFFLIGPWRSTMNLAQHMRDKFREYVAANPDIHFSAGLSMTKPGLPIREIARLAEEALEKAKGREYPRRDGRAQRKNAVTCFDLLVAWDDFIELMKRKEKLAQLTTAHGLSRSYLYELLRLTEMAGKVKERPENAIWHSRFAYQTRRLVETKIRRGASRADIERQRRELQETLADEIVGNGIERHGAAYKIALSIHLYQQRD